MRFSCQHCPLRFLQFKDLVDHVYSDHWHVPAAARRQMQWRWN